MSFEQWSGAGLTGAAHGSDIALRGRVSGEHRRPDREADRWRIAPGMHWKGRHRLRSVPMTRQLARLPTKMRLAAASGGGAGLVKLPSLAGNPSNLKERTGMETSSCRNRTKAAPEA